MQLRGPGRQAGDGWAVKLNLPNAQTLAQTCRGGFAWLSFGTMVLQRDLRVGVVHVVGLLSQSRVRVVKRSSWG